MQAAWTCDLCRSPFTGGLFYLRGDERWCEDCFFDWVESFEDRREFLERMLREQEMEKENVHA